MLHICLYFGDWEFIYIWGLFPLFHYDWNTPLTSSSHRHNLPTFLTLPPRYSYLIFAVKRVVEVGGEKIDGEDATPPVKEDGRLCDQMARFASLARSENCTQCHQISAFSSTIKNTKIDMKLIKYSYAYIIYCQYSHGTIKLLVTIVHILP